MSKPNWNQSIADWEASGLTQTAFCTRNNLSYKEFVKQRCKAIAAGKFEKRLSRPKHSSSVLPAFSKLDLKPPKSVSKPTVSTRPLVIEIALPNGINLRIPACS